MSYDTPDLLKMTVEQLDGPFRKSLPEDTTNGEAKGTPVIAIGTAISPAIAGIINIFPGKEKPSMSP